MTLRPFTRDRVERGRSSPGDASSLRWAISCAGAAQASGNPRLGPGAAIIKIHQLVDGGGVRWLWPARWSFRVERGTLRIDWQAWCRAAASACLPTYEVRRFDRAYHTGPAVEEGELVVAVASARCCWSTDHHETVLTHDRQAWTGDPRQSTQPMCLHRLPATADRSGCYFCHFECVNSPGLRSYGRRQPALKREEGFLYRVRHSSEWRVFTNSSSEARSDCNNERYSCLAGVPTEDFRLLTFRLLSAWDLSRLDVHANPRLWDRRIWSMLSSAQTPPDNVLSPRASTRDPSRGTGRRMSKNVPTSIESFS
jgi:hypothetical protein